MAEEGAGAWRRPKVYKYSTPLLGRDTSTTDLKRINFAVRSIQKELTGQHYDPGPLDGVFGRKTRDAVKAFQRAHGLVVDGVVGPTTAKNLYLVRTRLLEQMLEIPRDYVGGLMKAESYYDPGAQGQISPQDFGLIQINTAVHTEFDMERALDPEYNLNYGATRMKNAYNAYQRWDCAILQHNTPVGAKYLYENSAYRSSHDREYVERVLRGV
jgi:hypothetical protein